MEPLPDPDRAVPHAMKWRKAAAAVVGLVLMSGAVWFALRSVDGSGLAQIRLARVWPIAAAVVLNFLLTGLLFWSVTRCFASRRPVGWFTMTALIFVSGLLNYIPVVRAGLWGRAVFLQRRHGVAVVDSVKVLGIVLALAAAIVAGGGAVLLIELDAVAWGLLAALVVVLSLAGPRVASRVVPHADATRWLWVPLRVLDYLTAGLRLWLCFAALGVELGGREALVMAAGSLLSKLSGLTPNGLGLAEWVVAGLAALLTPVEAALAASAALLDRAVEVAVTLVGGVAGVVVLGRAWRR